MLFDSRDFCEGLFHHLLPASFPSVVMGAAVLYIHTYVGEIQILGEINIPMPACVGHSSMPHWMERLFCTKGNRLNLNSVSLSSDSRINMLHLS